MQFKEVAEYFEKIESVSSRLEMTDFLAELLSKAPKSDIANVIYLSQGKLGPDFLSLEPGMGEKLVIEAIAKFSGYEKSEIEKKFKKQGDLGLVAFELAEKKKQQSLFSEELSVEKVFRNFEKIAKAEGAGSQESKIRLLSELLNSGSVLEAKFLVRVPLGTLRLGIGDPTLMDALALNYIDEFRKGNKKVISAIEKEVKIKKEEQRKEEISRKIKMKIREGIEAKYNVMPDLGEIAKNLKANGLPGLKKIKIKIGVPIRPTLAERLPNAEEILKKIGKCAVEHKYDGFRCITGHTPIYVKDQGFVSVKDIKKGDLVLTHKGRFKEVVGKNKRKIDRGERLFRIQTFFGNEFKITEKHPVLTFKNKKKAWVNPENLSKNFSMVFPLPRFKVKERIPKKLRLKTSDNYSKTIKLDKNFFRFIGYWIGDGFTNNHHNTERVGIIFNKKDKQLAKQYEKIVRSVFKITNISRNIHNGAIYLYWRDKPFREWLTENFRREWKGKMLPNWFFNVSENDFSEFLKGWIESDGHTDRYGRTSITTKEKDLAMFAQLLGLKFKKIIGTKKFRVKSGDNTFTYYKLIIPKSQKHAKIIKNNVIVKILKLEEIKYPDPRTTLYNLQIKEDESYCTNMLSLHNCQIHKKDDNITIFSRKQENMTHMFPEIVEGVKKQISAKEAIIEGEAVAFDEENKRYYPFQVTIQRKRKYDIDQKASELPLELFVFDVMYVDGKETMSKKFSERRKLLEKLIKKGNVIKPTESIISESSKEIETFFENAIAKGLEGIIAKDLNAPYIAGARKYAWIKLKKSYSENLTDSVDVVIIGYDKGKGQRTKFGLGNLLTASYDEESDMFNSVARVGTGITEERLKELEEMLSKIKVFSKPARVNSEIKPDVWVEPKYVIEVVADEVTQSPLHMCAFDKKEKTGLALRFPRMVSFRVDKSPEEATTDFEIMKMYKHQTK